ncbi:hypothetical protein PBCV1_a266aR [Paramecium bursaria Chlorella virus 1]|uniref:Uncharacterized protein n=1 Tax=Paramecium bursaria Chlorella virus 1 TaxID=10506 RepID=F8TU10_PBCV1|nr:hypothetical protein PBCV1_a266aR [Paramecium bursaria Chlorella virus 1]AEI70071.1 hypothetical protein [Paramecium bursaria Chlorella virus 1]
MYHVPVKNFCPVNHTQRQVKGAWVDSNNCSRHLLSLFICLN